VFAELRLSAEFQIDDRLRAMDFIVHLRPPLDRDPDAAASDQAGAGGEVIRNRSHDERGNVTFTLLKSSPTNDSFQALHAQDKLLGTGVRPLTVKDLNGRTVVSAARAWISKAPPIEEGKEASPREWVLRCAKLEIKVGGSL
jgi:hypothetical protein